MKRFEAVITYTEVAMNLLQFNADSMDHAREVLEENLPPLDNLEIVELRELAEGEEPLLPPEGETELSPPTSTSIN